MTAECDMSSDPCVAYTELNDDTRSSAYFSTFNEYLNDNELQTRWYRGTSLVGGDMPIYSVESGYCSAAFPIYLTGIVRF